MNKRKILTMAMALCMVAILAVGGTLAYFTDTDYNKNVMVTGDVKIDQIEKEYDKDGNEVDFKDDKPLYPVTEDYAGNNVLEYKDPNKVDKIVTVKNTGHTTAYVRTLIAFEAGEEGKTFGANKEADLLSGSYIHFGYTGNNKVLFAPVHEANGGDIYFTKDGTRYVVAVAYYNDSTATDSEGIKKSAIAAGETTAPA